MSVETSIICDTCGRVAGAAKTAKKARAEMREGGAKVNLPGGKDICCFCVHEAQAGRR